MKAYILIFLILSFVATQQQNKVSSQLVIKVGQIVPGRIDPEVSNQKTHSIYIDKLQSKFLFIRLNTFDTNLAAIGLYENNTGSLIFSCMDNSFDTCYIPANSLTPNKQYVILIMSNLPISYNLYTYWGDLQHLIPNKQIKFMFDESDKTQLFHLDLQKESNFSQIRIVLRPETMRTEGDSLKMFANRGNKQDPTQNNHDYQSFHVWNDAQAIFINKDQLKADQKGVVVYIVGNAKTIYLLSCQLIRNDHHNINLNENLYEYINKDQKGLYHMKFEDQQNLDVYVVRFSVFTGQVEVGFYYDKQLKKNFSKMPFQYMSDIQFHIQKKDLVAQTKDMYMLVKSRDAASTFQLNMQGRRKVQSFEIFQNLFQFVPIREKTQSMHFYSHIWSQNQYDTRKIQSFDISLLKVQGDTLLQFFHCKSIELQDICKQRSHNDFAKSIVKLNPSGMTNIGSKVIYTIQINQSQYQEINTVQKRVLIVVHCNAVDNKQVSFVAVQVSNPNKVRLLREGRAFQDKVRLSQTKYYKYQNNNPKIGAIKIHVNQISGLTDITAKRTDTRLAGGLQIKPSKIQPGVIIITQKLTEPIFMQINGIVNSIYAISVSTIHQEHPLANSLIMAQDIQYSLKLLPYSQTTIQIHPIEAEVVFQFDCEGGSILVCQVDQQDLCKHDSIFIGNKGQLKINTQNSREIRIRLANSANTTAVLPVIKEHSSEESNNSTLNIMIIRTVKVNVLYHASNKDHCENKRMNKVYSELVKSGSCFKFQMALAADIEMMVSRENLQQSYHLFFVCSQKVVAEQHNNRFIIKGPTIAQSCKQLPDDMDLVIIIGDSTSHQSTPKQFRVDYSVQYVNDIITLADGLAYYSKTRSTQTAVKTFFYEIIDQGSPLQIILSNKKGSQFFYAKIVSSSNKYNSFVTEGDASINSKNSNYYSDPSIQIKQQDIQKGKCGRDCMILISVFSRQKIGAEIQFGIQVTQHEITLKQNQIKNDFLPKGSVRYFQYSTRVNPTDLLFKISDNNRKCAKSYLSNHPFPSFSNHIAFENEGSLTYKNAQKGRYYFAVQASDDCPFSITASQGNSKLTKLQHGQYFDIKLNQGEESWFYLNHLSKSSFKILSLLKHGLVDIHVNRTDLTKEVIEQISQGKFDISKFMFKNTYPNVLFINSEDKGFCSDCYYLVKIKAKAITEGSIFLGSESSRISLEGGRVLFDQIKKQNSTTFAIFYKVSKGNITLNVHSEALKYKICLTPTGDNFTTTFLSILQNEKLNLISPDTQLMVRKQGTFVIHQTGDIIVDIFECDGKADIAYSSELSELQKTSPRQLDIIGISGQNHAMRIQSNQMLLLNIKVNMATLLWMPLNENKEKGIGYYKYAIGKLGYTTGFNTIKFLIGGLYKSKETNTSVQSVRYTLHISNTRDSLQKAIMCEMNPIVKTLTVHINSNKVGDGLAPQIEFNLEVILILFQKKRITDTFGNDQTLYFNVVADLTLLPPNQEKIHQHYRFIYSQQLVLAELLKQNVVEQQLKVGFDVNNFVLATAAVSIGVIAVLIVFIRCVIPVLARLKNRVLIEDSNQDQRQIQMEAPPSSDRNQMATGTTDRMG